MRLIFPLAISYIMGYDFIVNNSAGALPHHVTRICEANERLSWLSTHYTPGGSKWTGEEDGNFVPAVKAAGIKSKGSTEEHLQAFSPSRDAYCRMIEALGMETPLADVFASQEAAKLQNLARYWHKGDSA